MRALLPYALPLGSVGVVAFLVLWERAAALAPPRLLCLCLGQGAEEYLEGRLRLHLWTAGWQGYGLEVLLLDRGSTPVAREIARRLEHTYSPTIIYKQENVLTGAN